MPRTDEASAFFYAVYSAVQEIPYGKVTSYGHIAKLVNCRKEKPEPTPTDRHMWLTKLNTKTAERPRQVGVCMKHLPNDPEATHHSGNVPWQRVINAKGIISPR